MAGSPTHRGLAWLAGGVVSTVATAGIDAMTNNLVIALLAGAVIALSLGLLIAPRTNSATKDRVVDNRQSVGFPTRANPAPDGSNARKTTYRGDSHPRFPLQKNHHNHGGEHA